MPIHSFVFPLAQAQAQFGTIDSLTWLLRAIDQLFAVNVALLPLAQAWGYVFAVASLIYLCFTGAIYAIRQQASMVLPEAIFWVCRLLFVSFALGFYVRPIPGIGVSFPDFFTLVGSQIAGIIGLQTLDTLLGQINACAQGLEHPPLWNIFGLVIYFFVLGAMTVLDGVLLLITGLGFFFVAIGKVFGSILIAFYLLPGWRQKFWNWVNFMIVYSFYRAVAAAFVLVVSTFLVNFFQNAVAGDYSLGHFIALFTFIISSIVMVIMAVLKVPHVTVELFGGGLGHAGSDFGSSLRSLVFMLARP